MSVKFGLGMLGAVLGPLFCWAAVKADEAVEKGRPFFPAPGGDDDFSIRAAVFLLGVLPAFIALGVWLGLTAATNKRRAALMTAGVGAGTLLAFALTRLLAPTYEGLSTSAAANGAVAASFLGWVVLAWLGAFVLGRWRRGGVHRTA
jgi:hypothetical protein